MQRVRHGGQQQTSKGQVRPAVTDSTVIGYISTGILSKVDVTFKEVKDAIKLFSQGQLNKLNTTNPLFEVIPNIFIEESSRLLEFQFVFIVTLFCGILKPGKHMIDVKIIESGENYNVKIDSSGQELYTFTSEKNIIDIGIENRWLIVSGGQSGSFGTEYTFPESFELLKLGKPGEYSMGVNPIIGRFSGMRVYSDNFTIGSYNMREQLDCASGIAVRYHNNKLLVTCGRFESGIAHGEVKIGVSPTTIMQCNMVKGIRDINEKVVLVNVVNPNLRLGFLGLCGDDMKPTRSGKLIVEERNRSGEFVKTRSYIGDFAGGMYPTKGALKFSDGSDRILFYGILDDKGEIVAGRLRVNNKHNKLAPYGFMFIGSFSNITQEGMVVKGSLSYCPNETSSMTSEIKKIYRPICIIGNFRQESRKYLSENGTKATVLFYGNRLQGSCELSFRVATSTTAKETVNKPVNKIEVKLGVGTIVWTELETSQDSKAPECNIVFNVTIPRMKFSGDFSVVKDGEVIRGIICNEATAVIGDSRITGSCKLEKETMLFTTTDGDSYTIILNDDLSTEPQLAQQPSTPKIIIFRPTEGQLKDGKFDGSGEFTELDSNGDIIREYTGGFKQSEFNDNGTLIVVNNSKKYTYTGSFVVGKIVIVKTIIIGDEKRIFSIESRDGNYLVGKVSLDNGNTFKAKFNKSAGEITAVEDKLTYPDGAVYEGKFDPMTGVPSGAGKLRIGDKVYEGTFKGGKFPIGDVTITTSGKVVFKGRITLDGKMSQGICTVVHRDITEEYEGRFINEKLEGDGTYTKFNLERKVIETYIGKFKQGKFNDKNGKLVVVNNYTEYTYTGNFISGRITKGRICFGVGNTFIINLRGDDHLVGEVSLENNNITFKAKFNESTGKITAIEDKLIYVDGAVYGGKFDPMTGATSGKGVLTIGDKTCEGRFIGGKFPTGDVTITTSGKVVFKGIIDESGNMVRGVQYYSNGATFDGTFEEGKLKSGEYKTPLYTVNGKNFIVSGGVIRCNACKVAIIVDGGKQHILDNAEFSFDPDKNVTTIEHEGTMYSRNDDERNNEWTITYPDGSVYIGPFKLPMPIEPRTELRATTPLVPESITDQPLAQEPTNAPEDFYDEHGNVTTSWADAVT